MKYIIVWLLVSISFAHTLSGEVRKPPMGWSSWMVTECDSSCADTAIYNVECVNEAMILETIIDMSKEYRKAGYEYVIIDDCWQEEGYILKPHRERFYKGITSLATKAHEHNMKLGIFNDIGTKTGAGLLGSSYNLRFHAHLFARWNVDYVKMSACSAAPHLISTGYTIFGNALKSSKEDIVYATSWPVYGEYYNHKTPDYRTISFLSDTWRFGPDAQNDWNTILKIMDTYADRQFDMIEAIRPGSWADPDVLVIGNEGITEDQAKAQMAVWSIMAAPLIMSTDISQIDQRFKDILLNQDIIDIDQDPLGIPGIRMKQQTDPIDIWIRPITPKIDNQYSYAIAFVNRSTNTVPISINLEELDLQNSMGYYLQDMYTKLYENKGLPVLPDMKLTINIKPTGVVMYKATIAQHSKN